MTDNTPENETASEQAENRRGRRRRMLKAASISFNEKFSAIPCTVRDMSETGVQLQVENIALVPSEFTVHIPLDGIQVRCRRTWQQGSRLGAEFISRPEASSRHRDQFIDIEPKRDRSPVTRPANADKPRDGHARTEEETVAPSSNRPPGRPRSSFGRLK